MSLLNNLVFDDDILDILKFLKMDVQIKQKDL